MKCHFYKSYIIGLQWNPGKSEWDKQYGNVTGYLTHPEGQSCILPFRVVLTGNYEQQLEELLQKCFKYVDSLVAVDEAKKLLDAAKSKAFDCYLRQFF